MDYKLPKCDCGEELLVFERIGTECKYKIAKRGKRKKKFIRTKITTVVEVTNLECEKCGVAYEINWDIEERILRGAKMNQEMTEDESGELT